MISRLRYIHRFTDRHGRVRLYLRVPGRKLVPLPPEQDPGFHAAYAEAMKEGSGKAKPSRVGEGTLEALTRTYLRSAHFRQLGVSTQRVYQRIIAKLVKAYGEALVAELRPKHIRQIMDDRATTPAAANHVLRTLRALMRQAMREELREDDPTRDVERLKELGEGAVTWSEEDIAAYETHWAPGTKQRLALALLLYTGQRRSDVVRMGWQHIQEGAIMVAQLKSKGKTRLLIPLHPELAALLELETRDRLTFLTADGGRDGKTAPYTANGFYMRFKAWAASAGLSGRSPHGLRKAAARRLAEAGCSAHQIKSVTGHKKLSDVDLYTRAVDQQRLAREAMARIGTKP